MAARIRRDNRATLRPQLRRRGQALIREAANTYYKYADTMVPVDTAALKLSGKVVEIAPGRFSVRYGGETSAPVKVRTHTRQGQQITGYVRGHPTATLVVDYAIHVETGDHAQPFLLPALAITASELRARRYRLNVRYGGA